MKSVGSQSILRREKEEEINEGMKERMGYVFL